MEGDPGRTVLKKVAWRLIPLLCVLYFFAFLDRVNVSFAALTMNADLGFLLEAIPTIVLGFVVLRVLTDRPAEAAWLTSAEREWLSRTLESEHAAAGHEHAKSLRAALVLPRVWMLGIVYFGMLVGLYGFGFWLPQILASLGALSNFQVGLATMIPYLLACAGLMVVARSSDATGERPLHVAVPALLGAIALIGSGLDINPLLSFVALSIAAVGIYSGLPAFWAFASQGLRGVAAAGAIALINSIGNLGGFLGPVAVGFAKQRTGTYTASLLLIAACLVLTALLVMWMRARSAPMVGARQETY